MSTIRPEGATHYSNVTGEYYKADEFEELNWLRWSSWNAQWIQVGSMATGTLTPLTPVKTVELEKFDAPSVPTMPEPGVPFIHYFTKYQFVGSRMTCNPPPLDTDQDVLVLVHQSNHAVMERKILEAGFVKEGSLPADCDIDAAACSVFHSYRKGDMNYIVTTDEVFYQRFSTATELVRKYNLMEKSDRIQLFQAVLYGKWWA